MREDLERHLEMRRNDVMWVAASRIQSWARAIVLRKKFLLKRQSAIVIQKYFRQYSAKYVNYNFFSCLTIVVIFWGFYLKKATSDLCWFILSGIFRYHSSIKAGNNVFGSLVSKWTSVMSIPHLGLISVVRSIVFNSRCQPLNGYCLGALLF